MKINFKTVTSRTLDGQLSSPLFSNLGRDELNLAEFPFAMLQYQSHQTIKTMEFSDTIAIKDGQPVQRQWTVTGSDAYGLPVAGDVDIVIALLALTQEQGLKSREVHFTHYGLLRMMGWSNRGQRAFYDKQKRAYPICIAGIVQPPRSHSASF